MLLSGGGACNRRDRWTEALRGQTAFACPYSILNRAAKEVLLKCESECLCPLFKIFPRLWVSFTIKPNALSMAVRPCII